MATPVTLATRPLLRLLFCCAIYVAQGIPYGFVTVALAAWLASHGGEENAVGNVIAMAILPWSFKWLWGPVVDSGLCGGLGRRRPWLILAQTMMIVTALLLLRAGGDTALLGWLVLLHNIFVALQDVAIDALAVDMLEGDQRERASGMMYGSSYVGTMLGGAGLGLVMATYGLPTAVLALAAIQAVTLGAVFAVRERPGDRFFFGPARSAEATATVATGLGPVALLSQLAIAMVRPAALRTGVGAVLMKILPAMLYVTMTVQMFKHLGWTEASFAEVSGGFGNLLGLAAAVAAGFLAAFIGPKTTAVAANSILAASWILLAAIPSLWEHEMTIYLWFGIHEACLAFMSVSLFALFMRVSTPAVAATQFTASMALMNLAAYWGSKLAGPVSDWLDAPTTFLVAGLLQPLGAILLPDVRSSGRGPAALADDDHLPPRGTTAATSEAGPPPGAALAIGPIPAWIGALVVMITVTLPPRARAEPASQWSEKAERSQAMLMERETFWDRCDQAWFLENVPLFDCPDADIVTTWWYRWELLTKHLTYGSPNSGYLFTEFLDRPFWSGAYGAISCPAGHQLAEARWLRSPRVARDYARYWVNTPGAQPRNYSTWLADAVWGVHLVHPARLHLGAAGHPAATATTVFPGDILPGLEANQRAWHARHFVPATGLYWQVGHDDGMEFNISSRQTTDILRGAPSYRPSFIAYQWADLVALARMEDLLGEPAKAAEHRAAAETLREKMEASLWDERRGFFLAAFRDDETLDGASVAAGSRIYDSGRFAGSPHGRELIGYVPWQFDMPSRGKGFEEAWKYLGDPEFFQAPFGPSTVERHDPLFILQPHCCWWSGQSWPYATTQTLKALANVLQYRSPGFNNDGPGLQGVVSAKDYVALLNTYARTHRKAGRPYLAEACHPDTGSFEGHDASNHSEHYFHSGYADLIITGLVGLIPRADDTLEIRPLFPPAWDFLRLDRVIYRGREVGVVWDRDGSKYGLGAGLHLLADGRVLASSPTVGHLTAPLPPVSAALVTAGLVDDGLKPGIVPTRVNVAVNNDGTYFPRLTPGSIRPGTSPGALADGVAWYLRSPPNRWESATAGAPESLVLDLGVPRRVDTLALFLLDDEPGILAGTADAAVPGRDALPSDVRAPQTISVETWNGTEWEPLPIMAQQPEHPEGHMANHIRFAPRDLQKLRIELEPRPGMRVGLSEVELWGEAILPLAPAPAPAGNLAFNPGGAGAPEYPQASASHTSRYDRVERAIDGIVSYQTNPNNRWTAYESPDATDWLAVDFGAPRTFSRIELALYDDRGGVQSPEQFHVEVLADGAWKPVDDEAHTPKRPLGNGVNEGTFKPVTAAKVRVVFTHRGASRSGVSEIFVWEK
ncbi:MAG: Beta-L-arabinobiosidase precursor [Planctomycetota bacterium]|jgi:predicted MFS family arabinose efflux permease